MVVSEMAIKLAASGLSDIGLVRQNNEDIWMELPNDKLYVLADGMGGHQAGEIASKEAAKALCHAFKKMFRKGAKAHKSLMSARLMIEKAMEHANYVVYKMSRDDETFRGMGTTLCCLFFHEQGLIYGHVGDSRIYCYRSKKLMQLTQDHSLLRELVDLGQLNERQAGDFLYKNIITKAIGTEPVVEPSVNVSDIQTGDRYLMCSDGLTDMLTSQEIQSILKQEPETTAAVNKLVNTAKDKGGLDNITVILVDVLEATVA